MAEKSLGIRMSRARLFVLIDCFEQDLRSAVEQYLAPHIDDEQLLGAEYQPALSRRDRDPQGEDTSLVQYLDLRPTFDIAMRFRKDLSHELAEELQRNVAQMDILVPIRHRVMHGRPLGMDDPDRALSALEGFNSRHWQRTQETLQRLRRDTTWEPAFQRKKATTETVLHNLPEPDYDETGFVGRRDEALKLLAALKTGRDNIITITGEGGIGKTALALDVAYRLVDSDDNPFEAILWVSLKTERLTAYGVVELNDAIRGMDETVTALGRNLSDDFSGKIEELAESLEGIRCLIIIDNLESAQGTEVIELYEALPVTVKYLFTSRLGIGQLERRYPLPALSDTESKLLFKKFANMRSQKALLSLSDKTLSEVLEKLRYSPLAIRWYILSAEAGKPPLETLRSQQDLLDFCVKNVFDGLAEGSRAVLFILRSLDRSIGFDEFAVLTEMSIDDLRASTQELTRGALVVVEAESAGAIGTRLAMTATARAFLPKAERTGAFIEQVMQRERKYRASLEQAASVGQRLDPFTVTPRDQNDHPATYLLFTALTFAKAQQFTQALHQVGRARSFNPEFSEVYRVGGFIESLEGRYEAAISEFQTALMYAKEPWPNAMASYLLADVMARRVHNASLALPYAQQAHQRWPNSDTAFLLGRILVWTGEYSSGQELIEQALESATGKHRLIVTAAHVDSWARAAEAALKNKDPELALQRAIAGIHSGQASIQSASNDLKFIEAMTECCVMLLRSVQFKKGTATAQEKKLLQVGRFVEGASPIIRGSQKLPYISEAIRGALSLRDLPAGASNALNRAQEALSS